MHGPLRGSGHGEADIPIALPAGNMQKTTERVARPREEERVLRKQQMLTKRRNTRKESLRSDSEP